MRSRDLRTGGRLGHGRGSTVDSAHQAAQLLDRVVDRVGNGTRDVVRHRGLHGQVTVGHVLQFVHQAQNGGLVLVVDAAGFLLQSFGLQPLVDGAVCLDLGVVIVGLAQQQQ